jgi:hypothetical protein
LSLKNFIDSHAALKFSNTCQQWTMAAGTTKYSECSIKSQFFGENFELIKEKYCSFWGAILDHTQGPNAQE